jgi:hypothetical protein
MIVVIGLEWLGGSLIVLVETVEISLYTFGEGLLVEK